MTSKPCIVLGVPVQEGAGRLGCDMGPSAFRTAGLLTELRSLGYDVEDRGNIAPKPRKDLRHPNAAVRALPETVAWTEAIAEAAYEASGDGIPIFIGGDHSLSAGSMTGLARRASEDDRELFVLWLDSHPDFHTLTTTTSGNLHGVPMAYATGLDGFEGYFPPLAAALKPQNVCMMGIRSVDPAERAALKNAGVTIHDMRAIDENGVVSLLNAFLKRVADADGILHVSFDVDFLDPDLAPGVGTAVPGGATYREAHLVMEMLHDSGLVRSVDIVELNLFLDERGKSARTVTELTASLFGQSILPRRRTASAPF